MCLDNLANSNFSKIQYLRSSNNEITHPALKAIFKIGLTEPSIISEHDELFDVTALLLVKVHNDKTILPSLVDTIFFRNREGLFNLDLIWAFFEARDPYSLMLIANYLESDVSTDVKLARKLLDFVPSIDMSEEKNGKKQYIDFFRFFKENSPFLYFTGENFQRTSKPIRYIVSKTAKYLCKRISLNTCDPLTSLTDNENTLFNNFNKLDDDNQSLLSNFSLRLHYENFSLWDSWIKTSIPNQIRTAQTGLMF